MRGARGEMPQRAQRAARRPDFLSPLLGPWFAGIAPSALAPLPAPLKLLWRRTLLHLQPSDASFLAPRAAYKSGLFGAFAAWRRAGCPFGMLHQAAWAGLLSCALPRKGLLSWVVGCGGLAFCLRCGGQRGPPLLRLPLPSCPLAGGHRLHWCGTAPCSTCTRLTACLCPSGCSQLLPATRCVCGPAGCRLRVAVPRHAAWGGGLFSVQCCCRRLLFIGCGCAGCPCQRSRMRRALWAECWLVLRVPGSSPSSCHVVPPLTVLLCCSAACFL